MPIRIAFVCPVYAAEELLDYTLQALTTFFRTTADGVAIVVDDGSESWTSNLEDELRAVSKWPGQQLHLYHFPKWGGLTRSWNMGLSIAQQLGVEYAIAGNNDILFPDYWYEGLLAALNNGYDMAGPVSNAPGVSAKGLAEVSRYLPDYQLTDNHGYLNEVSKRLRERPLQFVEAQVNGFFQMAKMSTWVDGKFDAQHFYRPRNTHTSRGVKIRDPLMVGNEDEIQGRWSRLGWKAAVVPSSFIFHYRAVSRGEKHRKGQSYRMTQFPVRRTGAPSC
jgi:glycosyltransferase involved in cell wall biosynthesis